MAPNPRRPTKRRRECSRAGAEEELLPQKLALGECVRMRSPAQTRSARESASLLSFNPHFFYTSSTHVQLKKNLLEKKTGDVAVLEREHRYVYYLITKHKYSHKPTYDNLQKSLEAMKLHCLKNSVTCISMPKIGCGLDRLEWSKVSTMIEEIFEDTDINITVYIL
uniref:O-acyl-ADP-ribose deacylase 1 n=1 Tax=Salvator merianae TaxID=96440 RepID=A0A8D0E611_SALMN